MKLKLRIFTLMLAALMLVSNTPTVAYAASNLDNDKNVIWYLENHSPAGKNVEEWEDDEIAEYFSIDIQTEDQPDKLKEAINGHNIYYNKSKSDEIKLAIDRAYASLNATDQINNITNGIKLGADTARATDIMSGFTPLLSIVLGLLVIIITLAMTVFSGLDICYIVFPVFRGKVEEKTGGAKTRWITDDAVQAVKVSTTDNNSKNPLIIYFGKRVISYIILAILLFILLTGNISLLTNIALKMVSGILEVIQGLA